ncbi:MAG: MBL fold metallo-hydrolase [Bacteroidales bacterium]
MHKIKSIISIIVVIMVNILSLSGQEPFEKDTFTAGKGTLEITFIGHGTLMLSWNGYIIHIDPVSGEADYSTLPDADMILVTHEHGDHLDPSAIGKIMKKGTLVICNGGSASRIDNPTRMKNGDKSEFDGIMVEAVPAYNIVNQRSPGNPFHPKGTGNGYILDIGGKRVYIAGDTENIPEMTGFREG